MTIRSIGVALLVGGLIAATGSQPSSAGEKAVSAHGVRLVVPSAWRRTAPAHVCCVTDPRTVLVVGTPGVSAKPSARCSEIAAYRLPPTGAIVLVVGWKTGTSGTLKPGRYPLKALVTVRRHSMECFAGRAAGATLKLGGKHYQVDVMVGDRSSKQRIAEALAVARSFDLAR